MSSRTSSIWELLSMGGPSSSHLPHAILQVAPSKAQVLKDLALLLLVSCPIVKSRTSSLRQELSLSMIRQLRLIIWSMVGTTGFRTMTDVLSSKRLSSLISVAYQAYLFGQLIWTPTTWTLSRPLPDATISGDHHQPARHMTISISTTAGPPSVVAPVALVKRRWYIPTSDQEVAVQTAIGTANKEHSAAQNGALRTLPHANGTVRHLSATANATMTRFLCWTTTLVTPNIVTPAPEKYGAVLQPKETKLSRPARSETKANVAPISRSASQHSATSAIKIFAVQTSRSLRTVHGTAQARPVAEIVALQARYS
jgi:hypothetical protein